MYYLLQWQGIFRLLGKFCVCWLAIGVVIMNNNIFITCNWVVTRWQWLFYMYTKYEIDY